MVTTDTLEAPKRDPFANPERAFDFALTAPEPVKTPVLDWVAFGLAFLIPPVGLIMSVVARMLGRRQRGWTTRAARSATAISIALTIVMGIGVAVGWELVRQQVARDELVAQSQPLCALERTHPGMLADPAFGWPPLESSIQASIVSMTEYELLWKNLAGSAPEKIQPDVQAVASAAESIVTNVETSRIIDHSKNVAQMTAVASSSGIPAWVAEYCK